jgi:putative effector of murein hydrolase
MTALPVNWIIGFGILLTAGAYALSLWMRKRYSSPLTTPVLFSTAIVIVVLLLCGVSFE